LPEQAAFSAFVYPRHFRAAAGLKGIESARRIGGQGAKGETLRGRQVQMKMPARRSRCLLSP